LAFCGPETVRGQFWPFILLPSRLRRKSFRKFCGPSYGKVHTRRRSGIWNGGHAVIFLLSFPARSRTLLIC